MKLCELINNVAQLFYLDSTTCRMIILQDYRIERGMMGKMEIERGGLGQRGLMALFEMGKIVGMLMA